MVSVIIITISIISSCNMNKNDQNNISVVIVSKTGLHGLPRSTSMQYLPPSCQVHFIAQVSGFNYNVYVVNLTIY